MELKVIGESEKEIWDKVVYESPQGTLFHSWKWLKIVEEHSKKIVLGKSYLARLFPLMVFEKTEIVGIIPVFFYDIPFIKTVLSPATGVENLYLGPVLYNQEKLNQNKQQTRLLEFQNQIDNFIKKTLKAEFCCFYLHYFSLYLSKSLNNAGMQKRYIFYQHRLS